MVSKNNWWIFVLAFSFLTANWIPTACAQDKQAKAKEPKKIETVAVVNGMKISAEDYDREVGRYQQQMAMMGQAPTPEQMTE
ncbi:MAG: SurA N-terminal domain-containing protein, partial [Desulforhabdus sp.]|nr:SurA N-terminal domain-containing protein [Desulforhabdus sp.]